MAHDDPDSVSSNRSDNPALSDMIAARLTRRRVITGGLGFGPKEGWFSAGHFLFWVYYATPSLKGNAVLRWEYRPGSALFLVWQQGRSDSENQRGNRSLGGDLDRLFGAHPDNTFLIKVSYWLDR